MWSVATPIDAWLTDWVKDLHPTWYKMGHFGEVLPSQSLGIVQKKLNLTQQKTIDTRTKQSKLNQKKAHNMLNLNECTKTKPKPKSTLIFKNCSCVCAYHCAQILKHNTPQNSSDHFFSNVSIRHHLSYDGREADAWTISSTTRNNITTAAATTKIERETTMIQTDREASWWETLLPACSCPTLTRSLLPSPTHTHTDVPPLTCTHAHTASCR